MRISVPGEVMALVFLALSVGLVAAVTWPIDWLVDRCFRRLAMRRYSAYANRCARELLEVDYETALAMRARGEMAGTAAESELGDLELALERVGFRGGAR